jgi:hypothetical protein
MLMHLFTTGTALAAKGNDDPRKRAGAPGRLLGELAIAVVPVGIGFSHHYPAWGAAFSNVRRILYLISSR